MLRTVQRTLPGVVAVAAALLGGVAFVGVAPESANAALAPGQWLQLNFTDGWDPPLGSGLGTKDNFNYFITNNSGHNSTTGDTTSMIDSEGNLVAGVSLTAADWSGRNWDGNSNAAPWPAGNGSPTPAALAGKGTSAFHRDVNINFWWDGGDDATASVAVHGLDPSLAYNVYYYSKHSDALGAGEAHTLDVNGFTQAAAVRGDRWVNPTQDLLFSNVSLDGNSDLVMTWGAVAGSGYNPVITAVLIQAVVPEPASIILMLAAVSLFGLRRRR